MVGEGGRIYTGRECEDVRKQRTYLECLTSQAIFWVETALAAMMRSPSFSLLSSSITTRNSPRAKASIASSIGSNAKLSRTGTSSTSCGREDDAVAGMSGKSDGWVPFIFGAGLEGFWEVERDDSGWTARATGAMAVNAARRLAGGGKLWREVERRQNGADVGHGETNSRIHEGWYGKYTRAGQKR